MPTGKHWLCSWNPPVPHHQTLGHYEWRKTISCHLKRRKTIATMSGARPSVATMSGARPSVKTMSGAFNDVRYEFVIDRLQLEPELRFDYSCHVFTLLMTNVYWCTESMHRNSVLSFGCPVSGAAVPNDSSLLYVNWALAYWSLGCRMHAIGCQWSSCELQTVKDGNAFFINSWS